MKERGILRRINALKIYLNNSIPERIITLCCGQTLHLQSDYRFLRFTQQGEITMAINDEHAEFSKELKQRFEEFATWTIANWPDKDTPPSTRDFDVARKEIATLTTRDFDLGKRNAAIPEPEDGGPQYSNVNPAPWP